MVDIARSKLYKNKKSIFIGYFDLLDWLKIQNQSKFKIKSINGDMNKEEKPRITIDILIKQIKVGGRSIPNSRVDPARSGSHDHH